jgi:hypothetical protein
MTTTEQQVKMNTFTTEQIHAHDKLMAILQKQSKIVFVLNMPVYKEVTFDDFKMLYTGEKDCDDVWNELLRKTKGQEIIGESDEGYDVEGHLVGQPGEWLENFIEEQIEEADDEVETNDDSDDE